VKCASGTWWSMQMRSLVFTKGKACLSYLFRLVSQSTNARKAIRQSHCLNCSLVEEAIRWGVWYTDTLAGQRSLLRISILCHPLLKPIKSIIGRYWGSCLYECWSSITYMQWVLLMTLWNYSFKASVPGLLCTSGHSLSKAKSELWVLQIFQK